MSLRRPGMPSNRLEPELRGNNHVRAAAFTPEHYLQVLEGHGFLHALLAIGRPPVYVLDKKGRAYAVGESLA